MSRQQPKDEAACDRPLVRPAAPQLLQFTSGLTRPGWRPGPANGRPPADAGRGRRTHPAMASDRGNPADSGRQLRPRRLTEAVRRSQVSPAQVRGNNAAPQASPTGPRRPGLASPVTAHPRPARQTQPRSSYTRYTRGATQAARTPTPSGKPRPLVEGWRHTHSPAPRPHPTLTRHRPYPPGTTMLAPAWSVTPNQPQPERRLTTTALT